MKFLPYIIIPFAVTFIMPAALIFMRKKVLKKESKLIKANFVMKASKSFGFALVGLTIILMATIVLLNIFDELNIASNIVLNVFLIIITIGCVQAFMNIHGKMPNQIKYKCCF